jgi:hypothetical protein
MKSIAKILLVGAVAMTAIAFTAAPSEAAKRKAAGPCVPGITCTATCKGGSCPVNVCGGDGKWYRAVFTPVCVQPACPAKC